MTDWKTRFREKFVNSPDEGVNELVCRINGDYIQAELVEQFIESELRKAKEEERNRIWKKGKELINDEFLDRLIRQTKEENPEVKKAFVNAVVEGLVNVMTDLK